MKKPFLFLVTPCLLGACHPQSAAPANPSSSTLEEAKKAIAESNHVYWQAFTTGDSTLFTQRYAPDACIMPGDAPSLCGPNAAPTFFQVAYRQMGIRDGHFTTQAVWGSGEYVTEQGTFELRNGRQALLGRGKYLVLWKKTASGWKMFRDSFSSDQRI